MKKSIQQKSLVVNKEVLDKRVKETYNSANETQKEANRMEQQNESTNRISLAGSRELAEMLTLLPREDRLRIEGIIIGAGLHCDNPPPVIRDST